MQASSRCKFGGFSYGGLGVPSRLKTECAGSEPKCRPGGLKTITAEEMEMLILTRRVGETVMIGDDVTITVLGVKGNQVRVGINAPKMSLCIAKKSTSASSASRIPRKSRPRSPSRSTRRVGARRGSPRANACAKRCATPKGRGFQRGRGPLTHLRGACSFSSQPPQLAGHTHDFAVSLNVSSRVLLSGSWVTRNSPATALIAAHDERRRLDIEGEQPIACANGTFSRSASWDPAAAARSSAGRAGRCPGRRQETRSRRRSAALAAMLSSRRAPCVAMLT